MPSGEGLPPGGHPFLLPSFARSHPRRVPLVARYPKDSDMPNDLMKRLTDERQALWTQQKTLLDLASSRGDSHLRGADEQAYNARNARIDEIDARVAEVEAADARSQQAGDAFSAVLATPRRDGTTGRGGVERELERQFRDAILRRDPAPIDVRWSGEVRSGHQPGLERRDLVTTGGTPAGMLGTTFYNRILEHLVDNSAIMAAGATLITTDTGEPLSFPKSTALSVAAIVAEAATIPESDPGLGKVTLGAFKYGCLIQVSHELAEDVAWDLLGYLARETGIAIANGAGGHFVAGTGTGQPRGVAVDATVGVTGANAATPVGVFTADNLIDLAHSLAAPYTRSAGAAWLMNQQTLGAVRKLKGTDGQYIFSTDVRPGSGAAGTLLGRPVFTDPGVAAIGAGARSVLFGDMTRYYVRAVNGLRFERSDEFAFDRDVLTFRALWRADGALIDTSGAIRAFQGGTA